MLCMASFDRQTLHAVSHLRASRRDDGCVGRIRWGQVRHLERRDLGEVPHDFLVLLAVFDARCSL